MRTLFLIVGKTTSAPLQELIGDYVKRIGHFTGFSVETVPDLKGAKSLSEPQQKTLEGKAILTRLKPSDRVILLDEHGKQFSSLQFASYVERSMQMSVQRIVYIVGGPYGFSPEVYQRADDKVSLSSMTFSHQMVRLLFVEQYYRALTIIHNLPYHHE